MQFSYWELKTWFSNVDYTIVGSGIVGLNCALALRKKRPKAKILVLEKGALPQGASTKNAGFACFGSASEILSDLKLHDPQTVVELVSRRLKGIEVLKKTIGPKNLNFQQLGGHEIFLSSHQKLFDHCQEQLPLLNKLLKPIFKENPFTLSKNTFGFQNTLPHYITHSFEGQIDTGQMMLHLLKKAFSAGILLLNDFVLKSYEDTGKSVFVRGEKHGFNTRKLLFATNGFAQEHLPVTVRPARAQVLVTKPIENLSVKGTFHFDEGYFYFRNIDNRILLGGGRNLAFKTEETTQFGTTEKLQKALENYLRSVIIPEKHFEIEHRWSGIMGVGTQKKPIIKNISNNIACGVRMGGMGVALGSQVGQELADLME